MNALGLASYGAAALAFLALTALLLTSWRGRAPGIRLVAAAAATTIWAGGLAWHEWRGPLPPLAVQTLEVLRGGAWLLALVGLAQGVIPRLLARGVHLLWAGLLAGGWLLALLQSWVVIDSGPGVLIAPGGLAFALLGLVLLEQVYRNSSADGRHGLKFLAIGLGGAFAYDLFLYSQAELFSRISAELWTVRGAVNALMMPLIAIAARRNPQWSLDVFVSRQAVMFTTAVGAIGGYLLLMAVGGYYVRQFGGTWGTIANVLFLAGALAVLAVIVLSGTVRRRLRVFISKHFFRNKYDYRVEWLRFVGTLSGSGGDDIRRRSVQAIAQIFESPGGLLYTLDEPGRRMIPAASWPMRLDAIGSLDEVPAGHELMRLMAERQFVVDLREYAEAPELYQNARLPEPLRGVAGARIVAPLLRGEALTGFVVLLEPPPPFEPTYEDRDLLKTVGRHVATVLAQHESDLRLAENRQFEAYHRLTAFMMHDLKNAVAQLQLVVHNAERHRRNPDFIDDALATIANAVERMNRLIAQLRDREDRPRAEAVCVVPLLRQVLGHCADRAPVPVLEAAAGEGIEVRADPERLAAAVEHVVRNAQDATAAGGAVRVAVEAGDGLTRIDVADTGAGMSPEFVRERLFRPFDSTKGARGMGIGAHQVREYVRSLGGDVEVSSSPGVGTRFRIILPVCRPGETARDA